MKRAFVHGTIITCDDAFSVHRDATLAVFDDRIVGVGTDVPADFIADETVDCAGCILMPGLVNAHTHLGEHLLRGWMDEVAFEGLFYSTLFRWEGDLTREGVLAASRAGAIEAVRSGVTTVADLYHHADATAASVAEVGMRALMGPKILGFSLERPPRMSGSHVDYRYDFEAFEAQLDTGERFVETWNGCEGDRIRAALCPHATNTLTADMLTRVAHRALSLDVPVHMHLAQMASERETVLERDGVGCVELVDRCGLLDGRFLGAHGIFIAKDEMARLARPTAAIVHNPIANAKDAGLIAPVPALRDAGVAIALGTDAFRMDLFEAARFAAYVQRTVMEDGSAMPAREALRWATLAGARALGWDDRIGSLEPGKQADVLVLDADRIETSAAGDPHPRILNYAFPGCIRRVYVAGSLICEDGRPLHVDARAAADELRAAQRAAAKRRKEGR